MSFYFYRAFHGEPCLALFHVFFSVLSNIVITSLWEERNGLCASRTFVYLFCTR